MKKYIFLMLLLGTLPLMSCETTDGIGEDLEEAGEEIEDAADDAL